MKNNPSAQTNRFDNGRRRDSYYDEGAGHFAKPLPIGASADSVLY